MSDTALEKAVKASRFERLAETVGDPGGRAYYRGKAAELRKEIEHDRQMADLIEKVGPSQRNYSEWVKKKLGLPVKDIEITYTLEED